MATLGIASALFWPARRNPAGPLPTPTDAAAEAATPTATPIPTSEDESDDLPPSVRRYLESTVYPPGTGRLREANQDLLHPNERHEDYRRVLDTYSENLDEVVSVRFTSDHFFYTEDDIVRLDLRVKRGETSIDPISIEASALREGRAGPEGARIPIRFHREGDAQVAMLDTARFADHHGPVVVSARIEYDRGAFYDETLRFFFTPPGRIPARFTGEIEDQLVDGSLVVRIALDVELSGFYRIDANLYDRFGNPVSFSSWKGDLAHGDRWVPIRFFGRVLRDVGRTGPFIVGKIRGYRFLEGEYPDRERIPDLAGRFTTSAYDLERFSDREFTSEHKERMVQLLLEDVANGISIDAPPTPGRHAVPSGAPGPVAGGASPN